LGRSGVIYGPTDPNYTLGESRSLRDGGLCLFVPG
jgi:hypothetical protein